MNELHLFAGAGGGILGGMLLGHRTVCAVEIEPYCRKVLLQRQRDGILPWFPIWDDVRTFDGKPWAGIVDVVCGGFPCQDISVAGKGAGIDGERSGLWAEMARIIGEVLPRYVFVENSPALVSRGLGRVLGDLSEMGFDARWGIVSAANAGAPHLRERIWILANASGIGSDSWRTESEGFRGAARIDRGGASMANADEINDVGTAFPDTEEQRLERAEPAWDSRPDGFAGESEPGGWQADWWKVEPELGRVAHGVAHRVDRLKAIGNGQVSSVAAIAWRILEEGQ